MASTNARRPGGCSLQTPHQTIPDHLLESPPPPFGIASQSGLVRACRICLLSGSCSIRHHSPGAKVWPSSDGKRPRAKRNQLLRPKAALCSVYVSSLPAPSLCSPHAWTRTWRADGRADPGGDTDGFTESGVVYTEYGLSQARPGQARPGQARPQVSTGTRIVASHGNPWMDGYWWRLSRLSHLFQLRPQHQHRYDTDLAALMPLQNMNLVQPSAARARPWSAMPSPSLTQAVTASCSRCWPKQNRPGNAALRGHSAHLSVKAAVVGCRVRPLVVLCCLQWLCVVYLLLCSCCALFAHSPLFNPFSLSLLSHLHSH